MIEWQVMSCKIGDYAALPVLHHEWSEVVPNQHGRVLFYEYLEA
jgi:hypothetical protein